ncbi:glycosyltransferase family 2 protein [Streptomyces sp. GESEQ-35]|uniref:glycosyltransferase family 2 protein n=1 Tax=Streptomyces sp. GESEQ-35 TaxID=2812657 RepID=UPI001B321476|nr:glycosyltransferase family 2 protein [Streptomyces sp. GESEQ-35]
MSTIPSVNSRPYPAVSLVAPVRSGDCDTNWLLARLPECVAEVILVCPSSAEASDRSTAPDGPRVRWMRQRDSGEGDIPHAGLLSASEDFIALMGADGSMSPQEIPHYLHYLLNGYDFVKGSRFIAGGSCADYPLLRRLGHHTLLHLARRLYGQQLTDLWYGFCAFRRDFLRLLDLRDDTVELGAELVTHAMHYGLRIAEVPSRELPRRHARSHPRTFHDGARILGTLLDERPHNLLPRLAPIPQR